MQFRIVHAVLATSLVAFIALPAVADHAGAPAEIGPVVAQLQSATPYDAGMTVSEQPTTTPLPDERDGPLRLLALVGLTITFGALGHDMRRRRTVYRP